MNTFWTQTAAAFGLAAVLFGLYYILQNLPGLGKGAGILAMVGLMTVAILGPVVWIKRTGDADPIEEELDADT